MSSNDKTFQRISRPGDQSKLRWLKSDFEQNEAWKRECMAVMRAMLADGKTLDNICVKYKSNYETIDWLEKEIYRLDREAINHTDKITIFIKYCLDQEGIIRELNKVIKKFMESQQASALVGAIKEKSSIYERVIKMGQDLGLIEKSGNQLEIVGGISIANKKPDEIRALLAEQLESLNDLVDQVATDQSPIDQYLDDDKEVVN